MSTSWNDYLVFLDFSLGSPWHTTLWSNQASLEQTARYSLLTKQTEFWSNPLEDKRAYVSQFPQKSPSLEQGTMTSQSQGIQQLLQAEKRAKDKLEEAKKSKCPLRGVGWKLQRDEGEDCGLLFQADMHLKCDVTTSL